MTPLYWAALTGFLFGLLLGILAGGWCTYAAMIDTYVRHGYDRGAFVDSDELRDMQGYYDPQPRNDRGGRKG